MLMKNYKNVLEVMENENLFGKDFKTICRLLSTQLNLELNELKTILYQLEKHNQIQLERGNIVKGAMFSLSILDNIDVFCGRDEQKLVAGSVLKNNGKYFFLPLDYKMGIMPVQVTDDVLKNLGKRCCCEVLIDEKGKYRAVFKKAFGYVADPISENEAIAFSKGFSAEFPQEVMDEVDNIEQYVTEQDRVGRLDLTDKFLITCDPASCKDKDDAVYAEKFDWGYRVYVAIADVSHYVKAGSKIDIEALKRGTSCYLGSGVYPMLPPQLSNGICSLNEKEDRLSLVSIVDIDYQGKILNYKFEKAVINVHQSFCYEEMEKVHFTNDKLESKYQASKPFVDILYQITDILEKKLSKRGALRFISNEPEYKFNSQMDKVLEINNQGQERSHIVIEQLMILANEATALFFKENYFNGIYRTHADIDETKLEKFNSLLRELRIKYQVGNSSKEVNRFLNFIKGSEIEEFLQAELQRTLSKAKYNFECTSHFGLASKNYTHFTSPIRRYSDTTAHRLITEILAQQKEFGSYSLVNQSLSKSDIQLICTHLNEREKAENDAERLSDKFLACLWAEEHIGKTFDGIIYKISQDAVVVKKDAIFVEIPYYILNAGGKHNFVGLQNKISIIDTKTNTILKVGGKYSFKIAKVDKLNYSIIGCAEDEDILVE